MKKILIFLTLVFIIFVANKHSIVLSASSFVKYSGNPILSPTPNSWDQQATTTNALLYENGLFKMWYAGVKNNILQIGYATSSDGINWTKHTGNPVLTADAQEPNLYAPTVIRDNDVYKMWYTTVGSTGIYDIKYATSPDGLTWTKHGSINLDISPLSAKLEPYVLKIGSIYKMWYVSNNGRWIINYATSSDGIHWTNHSLNPVLSGTQSWEGNDVSQPSVIYNGSGYEIFYHDSDDISYATSSDGINWIKPADKNPVITSGGIDPGRIIDPNPVTLLSGTTLLYYTRFGGDGVKIALAHNGPIVAPTPTITPSPTPSPTSTPTPTPTPTPSPTPSPTPTPTVIPVTKTVIVPGFGASLNTDALLYCKKDNYAGDWVLNNVAQDIYAPLAEQLAHNHVTPLIFPYDWRKDVRQTAAQLEEYIQSNVSDGEKINLVGHSMGGLVSRAYLEQFAASNKLSKLITVGSPHQGAPAAYAAWSGGEIWNNHFLFRVYLSLLLRNCQIRHRITAKHAVREFVPSIQNMLPTYDFLINQSNVFIPYSSMVDKNNWLPNSLFSSPFYGVDVGTISSTGFRTLESIKIRNRTFADIIRGLWTDGKPAGKNFSTQGDRIVLQSSAQVSGANNYDLSQYNLDHTGIISSPPALEQILSFLDLHVVNTAASRQFMSQEPDSALIVFGSEADVTVKGNDRKKIRKESRQLSIILNPDTADYEIDIIPKDKKSKITVGQFLDDGRILWKDYDLEGLKKKNMKLRFNKRTPLENPLE
jgi:pimeloyl-ACP methyl ester carboxylesterase/predicted GH43/DUF377 family glycosyl hydrolase